MKITPLVSHLRDHCPSFNQHIRAGLDLDALQNLPVLDAPQAVVTPICDKASPNTTQNSSRQTLREHFGVVLVLDLPEGQHAQAMDQLHALRAEVWRALVGYKPEGFYEPIQYDAGEWLLLGKVRGLYRLRFFLESQLGRNLSTQPAETWLELELDALPSFNGVTVGVDAIDPADSNLQRPGPDGRLEMTFSAEVKP
ncbi:phage tail terminator protein [Pseudomonas yamanorum]